MKEKEETIYDNEIDFVSRSFKSAMSREVNPSRKKCTPNDIRNVACIEDVSLLYHVKHPLWYFVDRTSDDFENKRYLRCICLNCQQLVEIPESYFDHEDVINTNIFSRELLTDVFHEYLKNYDVNPYHEYMDNYDMTPTRDLEVKTLLKRIKK